MKYIKILFFLIVFSICFIVENTIAQCQYDITLFENCKKQKGLIVSSDSLKQVFFVEKDGFYIPSTHLDSSWENEWSYIVLNDKGKLKKAVVYVFDTDYCKTVICYFDDEGYLLHLIYKEEELDYGVSGYMYVNKNNTILSDWNIRKESDNSLQTLTFCNGHIPDEISQIKLSYFKQTDDILNKMSFSGEILSKCKHINIQPPKEKDKVFINANNVIVRKHACKKSELLTKMNAGIRVLVMEVGEKENIDNLGVHYWYKVMYNSEGDMGYIFGAFLELVEKEINRNIN